MASDPSRWGIVFLVGLVATVGLFHVGINVGADLAGFVQAVQRVFATPL
jgi:hypothetical protein